MAAPDENRPGHQPDPARAWATEHYGFTEQAAPPAAPARATRSPLTRARVIIGSAVLALLLAGGVGGATLASADDGGGGGIGAFQDADGDGDGDRDRGGRG